MTRTARDVYTRRHGDAPPRTSSRAAIAAPAVPDALVPLPSRGSPAPAQPRPGGRRAVQRGRARGEASGTALTAALGGAAETGP